MNTAKYIELLETKLMKIYNNNYYILGDNDPKHNSAKAKQFLKNKSVMCIDFPPCSPDLNPIENIWAIYKAKIRKEKYANLNDLAETALHIWDTLDMTHIHNTINSMNKRLTQIIAKKVSYIN